MDIQTANSNSPMTGAVYWPNGLGYRECTAAYAEAYEARQAAKDALDACDGSDPAYDDLFYALELTQAALDGLKAEGGHLGRVVRFEAPDALTAAMGGGRIREMALAA